MVHREAYDIGADKLEVFRQTVRDLVNEAIWEA